MAFSTVSATSLHFPRSCFTAKERDTESGNDYFGARYYSSAMGRFMSPDWGSGPVPYATFSNPQSLNLYSYMRNNPLGGSDPNGHWPDFISTVAAMIQFVQSHPAIGAAVAKIAGSLSGKVNAGIGVEESIGKSGFKGSVAASATGFYKLSKNGLTTGTDVKLGASIETPLMGKLKIGGTSETISKENGADLASPGRTETSSETGIGNFTNDEKTFSIGDETGAGPTLGAELDVDKAQFSAGVSDLGSALMNALPDAVHDLLSQRTQPTTPTLPTENPAVPPKMPNQ